MLAQNEQRQRVFFGVSAILGSALVVAIKYGAYWLTDSVALRSDALENCVNVVAGILALVAIIVGSRPADRGHPYGHGKIEFFSAAFEGGLISLASILILYGAVHAWWRGITPHDLGRGLWLNIGAGGLNGLLGWALVRAGTRLHSQALVADGQHILADFQVTIGLAVGMGAAALTHWWWLDPLMAVAIGLLLARTGAKLVWHSSDALLDSEDPRLIEGLVENINRIRPKDILAVHELRAMRAGRYVHVDMHVVVPEFYPVGRAHDLVEDFGREVIRAAKLEGECHTHTDPCHRLYCRQCEVAPCEVRREPFQERLVLTAASATEAPADI